MAFLKISLALKVFLQIDSFLPSFFSHVFICFLNDSPVVAMTQHEGPRGQNSTPVYVRIQVKKVPE